MIPFLLGVVSGLLQTSFLGVLAPAGWPMVSGVIIVVYLNRFNLRRISHSTAWYLGLTLDCFSSWPFGVWLLIMLLVDALSDQLMPAKASSIPPSSDVGLVWLSSFIIGAGQCLANDTRWLGPSFISALIVALMYYMIARATIVWRIYE